MQEDARKSGNLIGLLLKKIRKLEKKIDERANDDSNSPPLIKKNTVLLLFIHVDVEMLE